jgi:pilus assembly protein FimV
MTGDFTGPGATGGSAGAGVNAARAAATGGLCGTADAFALGAGMMVVAVATCAAGANGAATGGVPPDFHALDGRGMAGADGDRAIGTSAGRSAPSDASIDAGETPTAAPAIAPGVAGETGAGAATGAAWARAGAAAGFAMIGDTTGEANDFCAIAGTAALPIAPGAGGVGFASTTAGASASFAGGGDKASTGTAGFCAASFWLAAAGTGDGGPTAFTAAGGSAIAAAEACSATTVVTVVFAIARGDGFGLAVGAACTTTSVGTCGVAASDGPFRAGTGRLDTVAAI